MLKEIFGVQDENRRAPIVSCLGRGYDIIHDDIKARDIFDLESQIGHKVEFGIQVLTGVLYI